MVRLTALPKGSMPMLPLLAATFRGPAAVPCGAGGYSWPRRGVKGAGRGAPPAVSIGGDDVPRRGRRAADLRPGRAVEVDAVLGVAQARRARGVGADEVPLDDVAGRGRV